MAELLAAGGQAVGSGLTSFGQGLQSAASGGLMPLVGGMMPESVKGLMDSIADKNDLTKDPYKPEQPIVYGDKGEILAPAPNPYVGLLSTPAKPQPQELNLIDRAAPAPMSVAVRGVQTSQVDPAKTLRKQAYGSYL